MTAELVKSDKRWKLKDDTGDIVKSGNYPLTEDRVFILNAADDLSIQQFVGKPYVVNDQRSHLVE